jgi:hypothetical protein
MTTDGFGVTVTLGDAGDGGDEEDAEEDEDEDQEDAEDDDDDEETLIDLRSVNKGLFKLQKVHPLFLAETLRTSSLIGVDPGLKSLITGVRSDNPRDKIELTSGNPI